MALARRTAPQAAAAVPFGDLGFYSGGGGLPDGKYAMEFNVMMFQAQSQSGERKGPARLGVQVKAYPLNDPANPHEQFYSMGSKADQSYMPNPETGKGIVPVPGGPGGNLNNSTNWMYLLKSLYDSGLPQGVFVGDVSVLDGIHVQVTNIPEPEERSRFQSNTSEVAGDRKPQTIAIVSEILDDGKPWEGSGGIPTEAAPVPVAAVRPGTKPAVVAPKPTAARSAPVAEPEPSAGDEDLQTEALNAITAVLSKSPDGMPRLSLRQEAFKAAGTMGDAVLKAYFSNNNDLNGILGQLGYTLKGAMVTLLQ